MNQGYCQVLSGQPQEALKSMQRASQELDGEQGPERDALASHLEEMARLLQRDPTRARQRVLELLGRAQPSAPDAIKP
jgi:Tfp pilus assembly protein PilF